LLVVVQEEMLQDHGAAEAEVLADTVLQQVLLLVVQ
jgi:hypothetical protein